mmetsp:Transcript_37055/g.46683  ORF Transcript_37055/g.46683 Transcript_37055/m.46683 type:complete len:228 (+) Transcript_37055:156-839(+)
MFQNILGEIGGIQPHVKRRPATYRARVDAGDGALKTIEPVVMTKIKEESRAVQESTALHCAAQNGKTACLKLLLDHGMDVDIQDVAGDTALHHACRHRHLNCIITLIDAQADMTLQNQAGELALDIASAQHFREAEMLIEKNMWPVKKAVLAQRRQKAIQDHESWRRTRQLLHGRDIDGLEGGTFCEVTAECKLNKKLNYEVYVNKKVNSFVSKTLQEGVTSNTDLI